MPMPRFPCWLNGVHVARSAPEMGLRTPYAGMCEVPWMEPGVLVAGYYRHVAASAANQTEGRESLKQHLRGIKSFPEGSDCRRFSLSAGLPCLRAVSSGVCPALVSSFSSADTQALLKARSRALWTLWVLQPHPRVGVGGAAAVGCPRAHLLHFFQDPILKASFIFPNRSHIFL